MNAHKINIYCKGGAIHKFTADTDRHLRAMIGKHGQLIIAQVEVHEDVDIETKKQLETVTYVIVYNAPEWQYYANDDKVDNV